jgi:hypothetical protein
MKKLYTVAFLSCFTFIYGYSQKSYNSNPLIVKTPTAPYEQRPAAAGCDTLNYPAPSDWKVQLRYSRDLTTKEINGYVVGVNAYGDLEKAAYFDASTTSNTYLTKIWIGFGNANSTNPLHLSLDVPIHVYDGSTGQPGALLSTVSKTLGQIENDVKNKKYTEVVFPTGVSLPNSKKFFISVDLTNLVWDSTAHDSLGILSNGEYQSTPGTNGFGYEKSPQWAPFSKGWGVDFSLLIFPFTSTNATCALTDLPITLLNFKGQTFGSGNVLTWTTATEQNNQGFEVQRSVDGSNYTTIAIVGTKAVNGYSVSNLTYQYTDYKPSKGNCYYRIKQIDKDGKSTFSPTLLLKLLTDNKLVLSHIYPNPVKSSLNVVVTVPENDKVNLIVTDLAGKVLVHSSSTVAAGSNNVSLNVGKLSTGSYIIKAISTSTSATAIETFVKQ